MRQIWLITGLIFLLGMLSVQATPFELFNLNHNFYPFDLNSETKIIQSNNFSYQLKNSGLISVSFDGQKIADLGFALYGEIPAPQLLKSWDADWNYSVLSNSDENITMNFVTEHHNFFWEQEWTFLKNQNPKIVQNLTNNTGITISNTVLYEILDVNSDNVKSITYFNDANQARTFVFGQADVGLNGNFNLANGKIIFNRDKNSFFDFSDLFAEFNVVYVFAGNLNNANVQLPDSNGIIIGFSKGTGTMLNESSVRIDPTFDDFEDNDYSGAWTYTESQYLVTITGTEHDGFLEIQSNLGDSPGSDTVGAWAYFLLNDVNSFLLSDFPMQIMFRPYMMCYGSPSGNNWSKAINVLYISDGSTDVNIIDYFISCGADGETRTNGGFDVLMTLTHSDGNNLLIDLNYGGSYTKSLTPLDISNLRLKFWVNASAYKDGGAGQPTFDSNFRIYNIEYRVPLIQVINPSDSGIYLKGGTTYSIDWNVSSGDNNAVANLFDLNYGTTTEADIGIIGDGNIAETSGLYCDSNNFEIETQCHYSWSVPLLDANYFIKVFMSDGATDVNDSSDNSFMIDSTIPSTSWDGNHDVWQNFDANIHLTCNDGAGSGCSGGDSNTVYRLDSDSSDSIIYGSWLTYDTNILVSADGNYAIDFNSTDYAGNIGDVNTFYVLIDQTPVVLDHNSPIIDTQQTSTAFEFSISVTETGSGNEYCSYDVYADYALYLQDKNVLTVGGYCTASFSYEIIDTYLKVAWDVNDLAGNITDLNSFTIKLVATSGTGETTGGGGGGGGSCTELGNFCLVDGDCCSPNRCIENVCSSVGVVTEQVVGVDLSTSVMVIEPGTEDENRQLIVTVLNKTDKTFFVEISLTGNLNQFLFLEGEPIQTITSYERIHYTYSIQNLDENFVSAEGKIVVNTNLGQEINSKAFRITRQETNFLFAFLGYPLLGTVPVWIVLIVLVGGAFVFREFRRKQKQ